MESKPKTVSLVLGGGGARGLAHIGVIRALEERGLEVRSIAGCSMGALVGGIHAMGKLGDYERWARQLSRRGMFTLLDFTFGGGGLLRGERLMGALRELVGEAQIEDLPMRFTAVAADLLRDREVWIDRGPLFDAIRASISLPLFFTPVDHGGVRLVDGGFRPGAHRAHLPGCHRPDHRRQPERAGRQAAAGGAGAAGGGGVLWLLDAAAGSASPAGTERCRRATGPGRSPTWWASPSTPCRA